MKLPSTRVENLHDRVELWIDDELRYVIQRDGKVRNSSASYPRRLFSELERALILCCFGIKVK